VSICDAPSAIIHRSFAEHMGLDWPPDAARKVVYAGGRARFVSWAEVHEDRRQRQAQRLAEIRLSSKPDWQPAYVWTFFIPGWLYHGWHCYVVTWRNRHDPLGVTFRNFREELALSIMQAVPLGLPAKLEHFERWMPRLAKHHPRKKPRHDPRRAGTVVGWLYRRERFQLSKPLSRK
jgi:hypothetical protein